VQRAVRQYGQEEHIGKTPQTRRLHSHALRYHAGHR
jgi:hypothetical protein